LNCVIVLVRRETHGNWLIGSRSEFRFFVPGSKSNVTTYTAYTPYTIDPTYPPDTIDIVVKPPAIAAICAMPAISANSATMPP
jgi:hypothetical protein